MNSARKYYKKTPEGSKRNMAESKSTHLRNPRKIFKEIPYWASEFLVKGFLKRSLETFTKLSKTETQKNLRRKSLENLRSNLRRHLSKNS